MTTLDRYLIGRFGHVFVITFVSLFGLYVVVDGFTNVDDFLSQEGGPVALLSRMAQHYSYRVSYLFDLLGGIVSVLAAMVTFALLQRNGELNPVLSAGIPTYRLIRPILWGALLVDGTMACNRELVIPQIAHHLKVGAGKNKAVTDTVLSQVDRATMITIDGLKLDLVKQSISDARFVLSGPESGGMVAEQIVTLQAKSAVFLKQTRTHPNGWLLKETEQAYDNLPLTEMGRTVVKKTSKPGEVFVLSDITFDRLASGDTNYEMLSTWELMRRVRSPSYSRVSVRKQCLHLHARITRPVLDILTVLLGLPLVARRGNHGLLSNLFLSSMVLGVMFGVAQAFAYLGSANLIAPDLAAWAPVIVTGTLSAWVKDEVKT